tara:strand:- start:4484 stop:5236 length:753 start_codon:yes stop_codon:yes gene_type:complete
MIKYILLIFLIFSNNINAELFVKKKIRFSTCDEILQTGNYDGRKNYILYNENNEPFEKHCEFKTAYTEKELINIDWKSEGDGNALLDTRTGKEWLKLSLTDSKSVATVQSEIDNGEYAGFRIATYSEAIELYKTVYEHVYDYKINWTYSSGDNVLYNTNTADANLYIADYLGRTHGLYNVSYGYMYSDNKQDSKFLGVFKNGGDERIYVMYPNLYPLNSSYGQAGVFLVSDGGATYTSKLNPSINTPVGN